MMSPEFWPILIILINFN